MPTIERMIIEKLFRIPDKSGNDVDFVLNEEQAWLDDNLSGRDIVAKARQMGFSTYVLGLFLARCITYRNRRAVIVSHSTEASAKLLGRIHYMIKHMKHAKPDLKYSTQNFITFNKTDSSIYVGTAGSGDFGVGDTITDLHGSEVSRWTDPQKLLSGLFQAIPSDGTVILESTGRGTGNYFHRAAMKALENSDEGFKLHFFNWLHRPEYQTPFASEEARASFLSNLRLDYEEPEYVANYGLTAEQLKWRRMKIAELDYDLQQFKENYPCSVDECFQSSGAGFFSKINYVVSDEWVQVDPWTHKMKEHPIIGHSYSAGVDVAGGVGLDNSVAIIFDVESGEQVLEFAAKHLEPGRFAQEVANRLAPFQAYANFERNNHGYLFSNKFLELYPNNLIHKMPRASRLLGQSRSDFERLTDWGTFTSDRSKPLIIGSFRTAMMDGSITIHSDILKLECSSFEETDTGKIQAAKGSYDDRVMAASLATFTFAKAATTAKARQVRENRGRGQTTREVFSAGALIAELEGRWQGNSFPISAGLD